MPRACKTCTHPERRAIEDQAAVGILPSELSRRYGVPASRISRHLRVCQKRHAQKLVAQANALSASTLLDRIKTSREDLQRILKSAERTKELAVAVNAIQAGLRALELEGRVTGELAPGGTSINIALGVRMEVAQTRLQAYDAARALPPGSVIERAAQVLRSACEGGDERATGYVRDLVRSLPRALPPSSAVVLDDA